MATDWTFVAVFILQFILFYSGTKSSGIVEIKLLEFSNPTGKLIGGYCCDYKNFWSYDCASCDHQFIICIGNTSESSDMNSCEFDKVTTGKLKSNQIEFTNDIGGVANPIKVKFDLWLGFIKMKITTLDIDGLDTFDFVDHYEYQFSSPFLNSSKNSTIQTLNLTGSSTSLKLELSVYCDEFSFGPTCDIICVPRDDGEGHYFCDAESGEKKCLKGWTGDNCVDNIDDCKGHQCQSDATCQDGIDFYTCLCLAGRTGQYCEGEINECASFPCQNGGRCFDQMASFSCSCLPNYTGERCEKLITACNSQPCFNNATCYSESADNFTCTCLPGYSGNFCEIDNDDCASNPCKNWATCVDQLNGYQCLCHSGYTGILCESDINECESNPCQNNGICKDFLDNFECICPPGTTGTKCENDIDECLDRSCSGNGNCTNTFGSFKCSCFPGFVGEQCDLRNPCFSSPCKNNANCLPLDTNATGRNYTCACAPGFKGTNCESDVDECAESRRRKLCRNGGSCINTVGSFECECPLGFTGTLCDVRNQTTIKFPSYTELITTENSKQTTMSRLDKNMITDVTELDDSNRKSFGAERNTKSSVELRTSTTEGLGNEETKHVSLYGPTTRITKRKTAKTTSSSRISKTTTPTPISAYITSHSINATGLPNEEVSKNTQRNGGEFFINGENFIVVEEAHVPQALTTRKPEKGVVTDCVLIKITGLNNPEIKPEEEGAKKEICWLVYDSIPPPLADLDVTITNDKNKAFNWILRTLENLTPKEPRPVSVEKECQNFFRESQMFLNEFSRYRSVSTDDKSTLNANCLQILMKTKRKGRGYFKNNPNNPNVRYVRKFKSLPRSLASKMVLCKPSNNRIYTTPIAKSTTNRRITLLTKLQTSTRASSSVKTPVKTFKVVLRNLNNTHVQRKFYYTQEGDIQKNRNISAPKLIVTVFQSARKIYDTGSEKAHQVYQETKILLHKTLQQLSSLWTTVHRISNVAYAPIVHSRRIITKHWNTAWSQARDAYSTARAVVHKAYQQARENFRKVYDKLKNEASYLSTKYYSLYRDYHKDYTEQVSKAADKFVNTYNKYRFYLTQYWKKYIKGEQDVIVVLPSHEKGNPFASSVNRRKIRAVNRRKRRNIKRIRQ